MLSCQRHPRAGRDPVSLYSGFRVKHGADYILVMEHKHKKILSKRFPQLRSKQCIVLDIEDRYRYMDPKLITLLEQAVHPLIRQA